MFGNHLIRPVFLILFWVPVFYLSACASTEKKDPTPAELLKRGAYEVKIKEPERAKATFQQIMEDYPDSKERIAALMYLTDVYYREEEFEEAKFHYQKFLELYPAHQFADRAHYYKAMSDYKLMDIAGRDQTPTRKALESFEKLVKEFPNSRYRKPALEKIQRCKKNLAENVFEIGKFYYRIHSYQSAILRLKSLIEEYPDQKFVPEAVFLLGNSYFKEQNYLEAKSVFRKFLKQYPQSQFASEARARLRRLPK